MQRVLTLAVIAAIYGGEAYSQINDPITNNILPNPYRTLRDWAELPKGMTWPAITGVMEGRDGNLYVLGRCNENSCAGRTEPAVLVYNSSGKLVNSWGSGLFNFPHGFMLDRKETSGLATLKSGAAKGTRFSSSPRMASFL
jgi:hypothetical protein